MPLPPENAAAAAFTCPRCGAVSHNPNDLRERYCGRCHVFVDDPDLFTCVDCGALVSRFPAAPASSCCAGCSFLRDVIDPLDRATLRGYMAGRGAIGGGTTR